MRKADSLTRKQRLRNHGNSKVAAMNGLLEGGCIKQDGRSVTGVRRETERLLS